MGAYDFKSVSDDSHRHELFAVVASVHHQGVCQALDDRALGFAKAFHGVAAGGVGDVDWVADLDVISVFRSTFLRISWVVWHSGGEEREWEGRR